VYLLVAEAKIRSGQNGDTELNAVRQRGRPGSETQRHHDQHHARAPRELAARTTATKT